MRVQLLTLTFTPALGAFDDQPLKEFLRDKELLTLKEHFFMLHERPYLACLLTYQEGREERALPTLPAAVSVKQERPQAQGTELSAADRALFASLREWRNARARADGLPPYIILTNRELERVVLAKPKSLAALGNLEGIGAGKIERFGNDILEQLKAATSSHASPVPANAIQAEANP